jgi:hypothetical protein
LSPPRGTCVPLKPLCAVGLQGVLVAPWFVPWKHIKNTRVIYRYR